MTNKNKCQGFSLMELMITVAILGILSSIAVPSYVSYVQKTKRTEAKTEILRVAQLQESYYVQNLSYAKAMNTSGTNIGLGFTSATETTERGLYTVSTVGTPATCNGTNTAPCTAYTVTAVPVSGAGQDNDTKCSGGFTITNTGQKGAKSSTGTNFTTAATIKECWN